MVTIRFSKAVQQTSILYSRCQFVVWCTLMRMSAFCEPLACYDCQWAADASVHCDINAVLFAKIFSTGKAVDAFGSAADTEATVRGYCLVFLELGVISAGAATTFFWTWSVVAEKQVFRLQQSYVDAILRKDASWFDSHPVGQLPALVASEMDVIHHGISHMVPNLVKKCCGIAGCLAVALYVDTVLTALLLLCLPLIGGGMAQAIKLTGNKTLQSTSAYGSTGSLVYEVAEPALLSKFEEYLVNSERAGVNAGVRHGLGKGFMHLFLYLSCALYAWYGAWQVSHDIATAGAVFTAGFSILVASWLLGSLAPALAAVRHAHATAALVFATIAERPSIDACSPGGNKHECVQGALKLEGVTFAYPTRMASPVLQGISLSVAAGVTLALVGPSGGGKSTIAKLLLRLYDQALLAMAHAHDFSLSFERGYDTSVGEGGAQLSGGQKQRIAIARAIIKDPAIFLLDEPMSALDAESEAQVQSALDEITSGGNNRRTTVVIAHRLVAAQRAHHVAVIDGGVVVEQGTPAELAAASGAFAALLKLQHCEHVRSERRRASGASDGDTSARHASGAAEQRGLRLGSDVHDQQQQQMGTATRTPAGTESTLRRIWALNTDEWPWLALGTVGAAMAGAVYPVEGVIMGRLQSTLFNTDDDAMRHEARKWSLSFVALALSSVVAHVMLAVGFTVASERLVRRLRRIALQSVSDEQCGAHSPAAISTALEIDIAAMSRATGTALGLKVQLLVSLGLGIGLGLVLAWQVALAAMAAIPLKGVGMIIRQAVITSSSRAGSGGDGRTGAAHVRASAILGSALAGISTVHAYNMHVAVVKKFGEAAASGARHGPKRAAAEAAVYGYSQGAMLWSFALLFWVGSLVLGNGSVSAQDYFVAMYVIFMAALGLGHITDDWSVQKAGQQAAARIFSLVDAPSAIDPLADVGAKPLQGPHAGAISFQDVRFAYPARQEQLVLGRGSGDGEGLSLEVKAGETLALVGASGSGKSTCLALLLRFYDPCAGSVHLDGRDVRTINLRWLRSRIGYVGQEPILFSGTIMENILIGNTCATHEEAEAAARAAHAHDFITALELGYDTFVGGAGTAALLSGGQKQRIAIAQAIIKNPTILLLDEATSALDSDSAHVVQAALDDLQRSRRHTTVAVTHNMHLAQRADRIAVFSHGTVDEVGTHADLLAMLPGGVYAQFHGQDLQSRSNRPGLTVAT
ncbi:ATP-binding cassette, sub-family B, member 1A [Tribonema minus]|uniref:ATP-binding cassette, sub-family B, member 1A n=1 Tax=Tribonema minus TaxID=303371 RepID=A0A836CGB5_9STRA|nr:ATP-binding cassette, sub-family B, member 1A [Tribonema minus]